jgi:hypothetical protein
MVQTPDNVGSGGRMNVVLYLSSGSTLSDSKVSALASR